MFEDSDITSTPTGSVGGAVNEALNTLITTVRFDETNYLPWFNSAQLYIIGKGKLGYLKGETKAPTSTTTFSKW